MSYKRHLLLKLNDEVSCYGFYYSDDLTSFYKNDLYPNRSNLKKMNNSKYPFRDTKLGTATSCNITLPNQKRIQVSNLFYEHFNTCKLVQMRSLQGLFLCFLKTIVNVTGKHLRFRQSSRIKNYDTLCILYSSLAIHTAYTLYRIVRYDRYCRKRRIFN